jgi:hypothetical protein
MSKGTATEIVSTSAAQPKSAKAVKVGSVSAAQVFGKSTHDAAEAAKPA